MVNSIKMITHENFGQLRLRSFSSSDAIQEKIVKHGRGHFIQEIINGVIFSRWSEKPDELAMIVITPEALPIAGTSDLARSVLNAIGLELEAGLSLRETDSCFDTAHWQKRGRLPIFQSSDNSGYEVNCGFTEAKILEDMKLCHIVVRRLDFEFPERN